jgi:hypothetical protein
MCWLCRRYVKNRRDRTSDASKRSEQLVACEPATPSDIVP